MGTEHSSIPTSRRRRLETPLRSQLEGFDGPRPLRLRTGSGFGDASEGPELGGVRSVHLLLSRSLQTRDWVRNLQTLTKCRSVWAVWARLFDIQSCLYGVS